VDSDKLLIDMSPAERCKCFWQAFKRNYKGIYKEHPEWPRTLEQAVTQIVTEMKERDRARITNENSRDLIRHHHLWGTNIRNDLGLWNGNIALLKSCGYGHGDHASMVIIKAVWKRLREMNGLPAELAEDDPHRPYVNIATVHHHDKIL